MRTSRPVAARTRARNSAPLAASRIALVATSSVRSGGDRRQIGQQLADGGEAPSMPVSDSRGGAWLMPVLMRASIAPICSAISSPCAPRVAARDLIELLPISMTATMGSFFTTDDTDWPGGIEIE